MTSPAFAPATVGGRIRLHRRARGLTQRQLAGVVGRSQSWMACIEADTFSPTAVCLIAFARTLGVSVVELLPMESDAP